MLPNRYQPITATAIEGGFGSVQEVCDTYLGRTVLFKAMRNSKDNDQLKNEIRALSRARSRHVVEIYDVIFDQAGNVVGIIIELLKGRDYNEFYLEAGHNPLEYIKILYQMGSAISDLHDAGIIHRDIKLDNVKSSSSNIVKFFDFGISVADDNYYTRHNRGTFIYAAPELYKIGAKISKEMDMYALGICAWALASNNLPPPLFQRPPQHECLAPSIASVMQDLLPQDVVDVIDRCLHPDPQQRPSAKAFTHLFAKHLLRDRHKGIFVQGRETIIELSKERPRVQIKIGELGLLKVAYDGFDFHVVETAGAVTINNVPAAAGSTLHGSCVLTFGSPQLGSGRQWVTFSSSHPEVVL